MSGKNATCDRCGEVIQFVGSVWQTPEGGWVCPRTSLNENWGHRPASASPKASEGERETLSDCMCDEYGTELCHLHKTHCPSCGQELRELLQRSQQLTPAAEGASGSLPAMSNLDIKLYGPSGDGCHVEVNGEWYSYGNIPDNAWKAALTKALTEIERLRGERDAGLEEAAKWHDKQEAEMDKVADMFRNKTTGKSESAVVAMRTAENHRHCALAIRGLKGGKQA